MHPPQQSTTGPVPPPEVQPADPEDTGRDDNLIADVPAYLWRHGCGPTAVGMVVGYYDGNGFPDLIPGDASTQTAEVDQAVASQDDASNPQHYEDYSLPLDGGQPAPLPDKSEAPAGDEHISNCIADFMETSWSARNNYYGWSWSSDIGPSFTEYVAYAAPQYAASYTNFWYGAGIWDTLRGEIDAGRPLVFLVDSNGDGGTDHFVTVIGYRDTQGYQEYACLDTWSSTVRWEQLRPMSSSYSWGVYGGTAFNLINTEVPSMSIWGMFGTIFVLSGLLLFRGRRVKSRLLS